MRTIRYKITLTIIQFLLKTIQKPLEIKTEANDVSDEINECTHKILAIYEEMLDLVQELGKLNESYEPCCGFSTLIVNSMTCLMMAIRYNKLKELHEHTEKFFSSMNEEVVKSGDQFLEIWPEEIRDT